MRDRPPAGYAEVRVGSARAWAAVPVADFVRDAIRSHGSLYRFAASRSDARAIRGRGVLYSIPGPARDRWIVRHLWHGGLLAPLTGDRFLRLGLPRPFNELLIARSLRELGIPTPAVVAAVVYASGPIYRGDVARDEVPNARDLASCLFGDPPLDRESRSLVLAEAGRLLRWLHANGVVHPDLNLRNILIEWAARPPRPHILDLEKCRLVARVPAWRRREMLRRLRRSARRFEQSTGHRVDPEEWSCFDTAYGEVERVAQG